MELNLLWFGADGCDLGIISVIASLFAIVLLLNSVHVLFNIICLFHMYGFLHGLWLLNNICNVCNLCSSEGQAGFEI